MGKKKRNHSDKPVRYKILLLFIIIVTIITFYPSLYNGFTSWDDNEYVTDNLLIRDLSLDNIKNIFNFLDSQNKNYTVKSLYVPLPVLTYGVEYHFFNLNPLVYHVTNLILHLFNSVLVFWLILLISRKEFIAFFTSLFFAIHPLHVESVAWISERKDLLYSLFYLLSIICYLYYIRGRKNHVYLSIFFFFLSLLSKPMAITLPFVLLLFDYLENRRFNKNIFREKLPFFGISLLFFVIFISIIQVTHGTGVKASSHLLYNMCIASYGLLFYILKMLVPINLSCIYPYPDRPDSSLPLSFMIAPFIIAGAGVYIFFLRKYRKIVFGILFFFITVLPVSQIIPVPPGIAADRYTYIPLTGFFYIISEFFYFLYLNKFKHSMSLKITVSVILIVIITLLSFLSFQRCKVWKDSVTLWSDVLSKYPFVVEAYINRGMAYSQDEEYSQAMSDFDNAIRLRPDYCDAYNNRGAVYKKLGEYDRAIQDFNYALSLKPDDAEIYYNLGICYVQMGLDDKALLSFNKAIEINSFDSMSRNSRGNIYARKREFNKAIDDYTEAVKLNPYYTDAYNNRGNVYSETGQYDKALQDFTEALRLRPEAVNIYYNRCMVYFTLGEYGRAWEDVRKIEAYGYKVDEAFLDKLRKASGYQE
jgi:tetratricopeptide (TPR) repeat protein